MRTKEKLKDLVGHNVLLLRTITTKGGDVFPPDTVMHIDSTWRGLFMLSTVGTVHPHNRSVRMCHRRDFQVLETT